jgi:colanic acid/amylovoran biosynthesis protein
VLTTGDDAIELALDRVPANAGLGRAIGVNLRISDYSGMTEATATGVACAVGEAARRIEAPLRAVAISAVPGEADAPAIARFFAAADGGDDVEVPTLDSVVAAIAGCRVVVTGSYHAAVFALSVGVPAICLASSPYYEDKFLGLAQQFGVGCDVVLLAGCSGRGNDLTGRIQAAWAMAPEVRSALRTAAAQQVARGHVAYGRIGDLVDKAAAVRARPAGAPS